MVTRSVRVPLFRVPTCFVMENSSVHSYALRRIESLQRTNQHWSHSAAFERRTLKRSYADRCGTDLA